jgi:hypothetical protein
MIHRYVVIGVFVGRSNGNDDAARFRQEFAGTRDVSQN